MVRVIAVSLEGFSEHMNHVLEMILARSERRDLHYVRYPAGGAEAAIVRLVNGAACERLPRALAIVFVSDRVQLDRLPFRIERRTLTTHLLDTLDAVVHAAELDQIGSGPVIVNPAIEPALGTNVVDLEAERLQRQLLSSGTHEAHFVPVEPSPNMPLALVADRSFESRSALYRELSSLGFEAYCRHSMVDALACAGLHRFQLMLVEGELLRPRSFYYLNELRNALAGHEPVIVVTATQAWSLDRLRAMLAGSSGFLKKPVDPDRLRSLIARLLPPGADANAGVEPSPPQSGDDTDSRRQSG